MSHSTPASTPIIYDCTPPITPDLAVFPGDTRPTREVLLDLEHGAPVTLSTLRSTVHLGAHVDGPNHYGIGGRSIDQQPLDLYIGPCELIDVEVDHGERVRAESLPAAIHAPRVLLRTGTFPNPEAWNSDFAGLTPDLVDDLAARGVRLLGVDTPSVDCEDSKDLPAHAACFRHDIAILEGLVLRDIPAGLYELIALPLPLVGFDGSPVRAILRQM
ncbi:MAG: cyclase family protein [Phycisphaerales bacterium]|nr:cyclase family protein [Phycisphaerales bacterium]